MDWNSIHTTDGPNREACCMWSQRDRWGKMGDTKQTEQNLLERRILELHPNVSSIFWHFISNTHLEQAVRLDLKPDIYVSCTTARPTQI